VNYINIKINFKSNKVRTGGAAQVVEHLLSKHKALSSNPRSTKNKNNKKKNPNKTRKKTQCWTGKKKNGTV
jgi:hypothetical protein